MIHYLHDICQEDNQSAVGKLGYFTSFLAAGTDCHCCLGWRILLAFLLGIALGLCAVLCPYVALGLVIGGGGILTLVFVVYRLVIYETALFDDVDEQDEHAIGLSD